MIGSDGKELMVLFVSLLAREGGSGRWEIGYVCILRCFGRIALRAFVITHLFSFRFFIGVSVGPPIPTTTVMVRCRRRELNQQEGKNEWRLALGLEPTLSFPNWESLQCDRRPY
jgi:hypothetical protein